VDGALDHGVEIDWRCFAFAVHGREALQPVDDVGGALRAFQRALDQRRQVGQQVVDAQLPAQRPVLRRSSTGVARPGSGCSRSL
jgi:hypothetical protein